MGKLKKKIRDRRRTRVRHSMVLGLIDDVLFLIGLVAKIGGWPVKAFSKAFSKACRTYPELKVFHNHATVSVITGLGLLVVSFTIADLYHHALWAATIETARAAGVCPIWEIISTRFVRA